MRNNGRSVSGQRLTHKGKKKERNLPLWTDSNALLSLFKLLSCDKYIPFTLLLTLHDNSRVLDRINLLHDFPSTFTRYFSSRVHHVLSFSLVRTTGCVDKLDRQFVCRPRAMFGTSINGSEKSPAHRCVSNTPCSMIPLVDCFAKVAGPIDAES